MAKILIISANLRDWTKNSGGKERTATLAEALYEHDVTFLSFAWDGKEINQKVNDFIRQIQLPIHSNIYRKYKKIINGVAECNHDAAFELLKEDLISFTRKAKLLAEDSDLVIVDHLSIFPLIENIKDIPIVYNSHNAEIIMAKQLYPDNSQILSIVEKIERSILNKAIATTYCSKKDYKELEDYYGKVKNGFYVPNGTIMQNKINYLDRIKSKDIIFVGSGHPPNVTAANKLIAISKLMPEYNFIICGGSGNGLKEKVLPNNMRVLGHVSDEKLHELFSKSFAFINPMDSGSGTHLKMMKALSYGIPIITSTVGARGFSKTEIKEAMLIADNDKEIIKSIQYLSNERVYKNICNSAYEHSKTYDWEIIKKDYANFINSFVDNKKAVNKKENKKEKILVCSIIRNELLFIEGFYKRLHQMIRTFPQYEFYLSLYENDSNDGTKHKILTKDWTAFAGVSIISENIKTKHYGPVKDADRVKNLANARNKVINAGGFINNCDYILMIDSDIIFDMDVVKKILDFKKIEPNFDIVSAASIRRKKLYDQWATRDGVEYDPNMQELFDQYRKQPYKKYYSTSNGFCLYRTQPFIEGAKFDYINKITKEPDCEMVVVCQDFHKRGYKNIYIYHEAEVYHEHV